MITTSKKIYPPSKNWKNWVSAPRRCMTIIWYSPKTIGKLFTHRRSTVSGSVLGSEGKGDRWRNGVTSMFAERYIYTCRLGQKALAFLSKTRKRHLHD